MTGNPPLPPAFLVVPIAHRGLHDLAAGRPENSLAAIGAAVDAGYAVELDLQISADGVAMVFHDPVLDRMTAESGRVNSQTAADLGRLALQGTEETIPTLQQALDLVAGNAPLLIEMKDQSGKLVAAPPDLEQVVADALSGYSGLVAVMSYNPEMVAAMARLAPSIPRGLVTETYAGAAFAPIPPEVRQHLLSGPNLERIGATFVSHDHNDLNRPWVVRYRAAGLTLLCWTVRSAQQEADARLMADNVTFEGYAAEVPNA